MADRLPLSAFIRPKISQAIRIKNPSTGEIEPLPTAEKPSYPASLYTEESIAGDLDQAEKMKKAAKKGGKRSKDAQDAQLELGRSERSELRGDWPLIFDTALSHPESSSKHHQSPSRPHRPPSRPILQVSNEDQGVLEGIGHALDIYARAFIPEALRIINKLDGLEVNTPAMNPIDFGSYIRTYVGSQTLRPMPQSVILPLNTSFGQPDDFIPSQYEMYFRRHLEAEIISQKQENEDYSLFGHEINIHLDPFGQNASKCFFSVPGLRENSPYIEEDDIIQLRQIYDDNMRRPFGMEHGMTLSHRFRRDPAPGWTGLIYNGRVLAVQRKQEQLVVQMAGFHAQHLPFGIPRSMSEAHQVKFNIQFPLPEKRYIPMRQALTIAQQILHLHQLRPAVTNRERQNHMPGIPSAAATNHFTSRPKPGGDVEMLRPWLQSMLFPNEQDCQVQTNLNPGNIKRPFFDNELNWEQKKAIESICSHDYGTLPFLISGPPGTGKTKTLVELAAQLVKNVDDISHVLFCAPSDPAADTVIQRISSYFKPSELLRLNRPSRTFAEVPSAVLPFCHVSGTENKFDLPPFKQVMMYKLVVTTCRDAALLLYSRLTNDDLYAAEHELQSSIHPYTTRPSEVKLHWNALLIDESAQAMEPEALIPMCVVTPPTDVTLAFTPLFVMAGDEFQLGPRTSMRSSPLKKSLLARLFARHVYSAHPLARCKTGAAPPPLQSAMLPINRPAFANLIRNYRSHPAILAIPSALFYADTLEPEAKGTDRLAEWSQWRGRRWPVLFRNNLSEDDTEIDGGGWYNKGEAKIACTYAALLVQSGLVQQKEVCIMTPFKAQVQCLRKMIREPQYGSLWDVDIGPTEAFQGLERGVVILCITRSKQRFVDSDTKIDWGIIGLPNKMNVALTRAKFGLIVIGKKGILARDPNWRVYLQFCMRNGLVDDTTDSDGHDDDDDDDDHQAGPTRLEKVLMANERDEKETRFWGGGGQDDEMWRNGMEGMNINDEDEDEDEDHRQTHENQDEEYDDRENEDTQENLSHSAL